MNAQQQIIIPLPLALTELSEKQATGELILGMLKAGIEHLARAGESYAQAAQRIKQQGFV